MFSKIIKVNGKRNDFAAKVFKLFLLVIFFILFYQKATSYLDPDFGWHYKMGELILKSGLPKTDPFSYSMPSYPFVDHEWAADAGLFLTYNHFGIKSLSLIFSAFATLSLLIAARGSFLFSFIPFLLTAAIFFPISGVRPQVLSWFFLAILIQGLFDKVLWKKYRIFAPLLFLLWVNLHGGFSAGIFTLLVFLLVKMLNKKAEKIDFLILAACILATLINPYGANIWREIWNTSSDFGLHFNIEEWTPGIMVLNFPFMLSLSLSFVLILSFWKRIKSEQIAVFAGFLLAALSSQRNIALWATVASPMLLKGFMFLKGSAKRQSSFFLFYKIVSFATIAVVFYTFANNESAIFTNTSFYPTNAVEYLKANNYSGNLFSSYNWGGFLIWQYPQKKVFIDGRMPSWARSKAPIGESKNAFSDYKNIMIGKNAQTLLSKYHVCTLLLPKEVPQDPKQVQKQKNLNAFLDSIGIKDQEVQKHYKTFKQMGFEIVFSDNTSVVYRKKTC